MKKIARRIAEGKEEFYCVFAVSFKSCYSTDVMTLTSEVIQGDHTRSNVSVYPWFNWRVTPGLYTIRGKPS
jgi:hypothetical protein